MRNRILLFASFFVGLLVSVVAGSLLLTSPYQYKGARIDPSSPAADFALTDQDGKLFKLSNQRGQVVVLFFGYTHCPDVCPLTLAQFRQVKSSLPSNSRVHFILISVDPERDTPDVLKKYLGAFDPSFIGLTGDLATVEKVWEEYGIAVQKTDVHHSGDYGVEHTARIYVVDPQGKLLLTYPSGFDATGIVEDLTHLQRVAR